MPIYSGDCSTDAADHYANPCPDDTLVVYGRVRSAGFVYQDYYDTLNANPTLKSVWDAGILSGKIIVIPATTGTYDPGDPKQGKGYGNKPFSYGQRTMKLVFNDPDLVDNYGFYNPIHNNTELIPFFVENENKAWLRLFDTAGSVIAKDPITDNIDDRVDWTVSVDVIGSHLPAYHDVTALTKTIFTASYINNLKNGFPAFTTSPTDQTAANGSATFTAVVTGTPAPSLQWQVSADGISFTDLAGKTSATLALTGLTGADNSKKYRLKATNTKAPNGVYSAVVTLTVAAPVTFDTQLNTANPNYVDGTDPSKNVTAVFGPAGSPDATVLIEFNKDDISASQVTDPQSMSFREGATEYGSVDFDPGRIGKTVKYSHGGIVKTTTFVNGTFDATA